MNTFNVLLCLFILTLFGQGAVYAQSSLEEEFQEMKTQFKTLQKQMTALEEKVAHQDDIIAEQEVSKQEYQEKIADLETRLAEKERPASMDSAIVRTTPKWTPEIGVVADVIGRVDSPKEDAEGADRISVRELELVLGSAVDPYSRLDATIAFSDFEEAALEEAYLTHFGLPAKITARLGKFKPKVGKAIPLHRDSLDTVDEPLVIQRYFGIEGLNKSGVDFNKILNLPIPVSQQFAIGFLEGGNGEEGTAFGETRRRPTIYSHLKNYIDLAEQIGFEWGFSHLIGSRDEDAGFEVEVLASDITLTQQFNANQTLKWQSEVFHLNRTETADDLDGNLWGAYSLLDFRLAPQWAVGVRGDYVEPVDNPLDNPEKAETGYTGYLTFHQSEFARWRAQFTHTDLTTGDEDNQIMLQGTFAIGDHKHKLQ